MEEQEWQARVEVAVRHGDAEGLRLLFADAQRLFGADALLRWAQALSAFDATAVTG